MGAIKPWHLIALVVFVILPLLVIAAVVALVLVLMRRSRSGPSAAPQASWSPPRQGSTAPAPGAASEDPRAIVDRRLALGEIGPEEHARLRRILDAENGRNP
ncbi:hypothetical protein Bra3105_02495 [Brachybacterium halotolerans subsp. kimchii]|uniref:hypothetical protein n=1 Tax=Brachybacterium halotolerans TaxID=2795215 RepID=UPI001E4B911D|nr:hypothetical protein [Brachybacterium halotolerans]UEJ83217.1 hypothetical protein Bra3105_02495 [Brachybacterium halotolerans subsp. kimchii]